MAASSPIKIHGGKAYLAKRIVALMPPHHFYFEGFSGSLAVLLAKEPEDVSEVVCEIRPELSTFWRVLQGPSMFSEFKRLCEATPFSQVVFDEASNDDSDPGFGREYPVDVVVAWKFFVRCRQSMSARGDTFAPTSVSRTRRGMNEQVSAWLSAIEGLPSVHKRLQRVHILGGDCIYRIPQFDQDGVIGYYDPPYMNGTRSTNNEYGEGEMSNSDHHRLLVELSKLRHAKFLLSGYLSPMYEAAQLENGWYRIDIEVKNHAGVGIKKQPRTECLWANYLIH